MIQILTVIKKTNKKAMKKHERESDEAINDDIISWCAYCKDAIYFEDDYVKKKGQFYHEDCWKQKHNFVEELEFEE